MSSTFILRTLAIGVVSFLAVGGHETTTLSPEQKIQLEKLDQEFLNSGGTI